MNVRELMTGNEGIARGIWEAGVHFASAYPGTPSTEILENLASYKDIYAEWAPNEKVALEAAVGASFAGGRAVAAMKHVGVNVAADPLFTVAYTGITGGLMVVSADDPGMHSSQNEQDNRQYARFAKIAMLEPSNSQEAKDYTVQALDISEKYGLPVMLRVTTRICHSKSLVTLGERKEAAIIPYKKQIKYDPIPAVSRILHKEVEARLEQLAIFSNETPLNQIIWGQDKKIGIIAAGAAYQYAKEVFKDGASYLKLGFTNPLPMNKIRDFANQVDVLYVIEELEPFMEEQIKAAGIDCIGKEKIPNLYELNPDIIRKALLNEENQVITYDKEVIAERPPTLCAGCPHRGFFYQLAKVKNAIITSDIGCYGLSGMEPLNAKDIAICMGGGFSVAHGAQTIFNMAGSDKRCVGVMGDSTFFHSGMTSMLDAVYNNSNVLLTILDNRITGMTGHQENPGSGFTLQGKPTVITDIEEVVRALGVKHIRIVNPLNLEEVKEAIKWGMEFDSPAVIITRWPCVLKKLTQADEEEFGNYKARNTVIEDTCIGCQACIKTGCPALEYHKDSHKVTIDPGSCVACDICSQVCPKNAITREVQ